MDDPERGMIIVASATHKTRSMFFFLLQTEQGDLFKLGFKIINYDVLHYGFIHYDVTHYDITHYDVTDNGNEITSYIGVCGNGYDRDRSRVLIYI